MSTVPTRAQVPLAWETVGDRPVKPNDLAFGPGGELWAAAGAAVLHLDNPGSPGATWELRREWTYDAVLSLGPDTVLVTTGYATLRSTDGGRTFAAVHDRGEGEVGGQALVEGPRGGLFVATTYGAARSADRGATWVDAVGADTTISAWGVGRPPAPGLGGAGPGPRRRAQRG